MARQVKCELSIVVPLFNEEGNISALFKELNALKAKLPSKTEVILVDDGSKDGTVKKVKSTPLKFRKKILPLSRNFGHQAALLAGLEEAAGKYVVTMDGDLQHPPSLIVKLLNQHKKGIDIVLTQRLDTEATSQFKKKTAGLFYQVINAVSQTHVSANSSDFRSLNRKAVDAVLSLPEKRKFLRGIVEWVGFTSVVIPFTVQPRNSGKSKYSLLKMIRLAFHGVTSFSALPLYFSGLFSLILFLLAILYAVYVLMVRFVLGGAVSGWASVLFVVLVVGGFNCLFLGLIGVYIAAIYDEVKSRPMYIKKN